MDAVKCAYPVSAIGTGVSGAWKIMGADRRHYLVKFHTKGDHTVINEMLCSYLAGLFGLPSLRPVLVTVGEGPVEQINKAREKDGLVPVEAGVHFGVEFVEPFLTVKSLDSVGIDLTADMIDNHDIVPDILGFDTLVQNHDRHCGNTGVEPNAFGTGYSYRIFDFGHAFGGSAWTVDDVKRTYEALAPLRRFCLITDKIKPPGDFEHFLEAFELLLEQWLGEFVRGMPPELGPDARADAEVLKSTLVALERSALEEAMLEADIPQG